MELREFPRYRVKYRSSVSSGETLTGEGSLMDLSVRGCRVSTGTRVATGTDLELHLYLPDREWPAEITRARVQWTTGAEVGVDFLQLSGETAERIRLFVSALDDIPSH